MDNPASTVQIKLTPDQVQLADNTIRMLQDIGPLIQKAQLCGIECSGHESLRNHLLTITGNLKTEFGTFTEPQVY